jgi:hypothetical protein
MEWIKHDMWIMNFLMHIISVSILNVDLASGIISTLLLVNLAFHTYDRFVNIRGYSLSSITIINIILLLFNLFSYNFSMMVGLILLIFYQL